MKTDKKNIEGFFSEAFKEHTIVPERNVLRKLRFRLWKKEFLSLNLQKFNFIYATIIIAAGIIVPFSLKEQAESIESTTPRNNVVKAAALEQNKQAQTKTVVEEVIVGESVVTKENARAATIAKFKPSANEGCVPLLVEFENVSKNAASFYWDFGDGETSKESNPIHKYKASGKYTAKLFATDHNNKELKYELAIRVFDSPTSDFSLNMDKSDMETKQVVFENKSIGASSYIWDFGDNSPETTEEYASHKYSQYKSYHVKLIAVSQYGCADTLVKTNKFIDKNYLLSFPISFRPNIAGATNNGFYGRSGSENSIFYPENNGVESYELDVYAPDGMKVFSTKNIQQGWNGYYRGRMMPAGLYDFTAKGIYPNGKTFAIQDKVKVVVEDYHEDY